MTDINRAWDQAVAPALQTHWRAISPVPTLLQYALAARSTALAFTRINEGSQVDVCEWREAEIAALTAASVFFTALEAETGIGRDLFRQLGSLA